jgi:hypothetical protein
MEIENSLERQYTSRPGIDAVPVLIWESDPDGHLLSVNQFWCDFTGLKRESLTGDSARPLRWGELAHADDRVRVREEINRAMAARAPLTIEYRVPRHDGEWRTIFEQAVPLMDEEGNFRGYAGSAVDVTETVRRRDDAERANRAKSNFLAGMSHEIRTPLGAMLGFADLLRDDELTTRERHHYLDIIKRNGDELLNLLSEILDLSRIEEGRFSLEFSLVRVRELVSEVTALLRLKAMEKGLALLTKFDEGVPEWIEADRTRLRQILINLIDNAIKFTPRGWVRITVTKSGESVLFSVEDTGSGVPPEARAGLFQPFLQGPQSKSRGLTGTGLGLALSRQMARLLGGDLKLDESYEAGARFNVTIPPTRLTRPTSPEAREGRRANLEAPLNGIRVLLVEDLKDNQYLVRTWLERNGASVDIAENGEEGIRKAETGVYEILLMDIQMPVLDGIEAVKRLRRRGYLKPIVALTAYAMRGDRERFLKAGFDRYLTKPLDLKELVRTVLELRASAGQDAIL